MRNIKQEFIMIFRHTISIVFCLNNMVAFSQIDAPPLLPNIDTIEQKLFYCGEPPLYIHPSEEQPEFEGGESAMRTLIYDNMQWPNDVCAEGTVYIGFIITKEGKLEDVKVKRGLGTAFNDEAIRLVKLLDGKWKAGKQNGRAVSVAYTIPIKFKLE